MSGSTEATVQVARKRHRCSWCGEAIEIGATYARWRWFPSDGDEPGTMKMHEECREAQRLDPEPEFYLYDNERPKVAA